MQKDPAEIRPKRIRPEHIVLGILIVFFAAMNLIWLHEETAPVSWDQSAHSAISLRFYRIFKSFDFFSSNYAHLAKRLLDVTHYYPPFFYLTTVPFTLIFGFSLTTVCATQILYIALLVFSIYAIGKYFLNPWVGVGAAILTMLSPMSFGLSRNALLDFPLMAMVALVQYLLLKSRGGTAIRWSWLLGLAMGFCFLTKWTGPVFFVGTALFVFIASWLSLKLPKKNMLLALAICLVVGLIVALPWVIRSFPDLVEKNRYLNEVDVVRRGLPKPFSLQSFLAYWNSITGELISNILLPFTVIGIAGFFLWAKKWKPLAYLGCWIVPAYIFFVGLPNKDTRFIAPILPAIALLTVAGLSALPWPFIRKAVWLALLLAGLLQFFMTSFGWPIKMERVHARPPLKEDWSLNVILEDLEKRFNRRPIVVGFLPDLPYFNAPNLRFYADLRELPYDIRGLGDGPITPGLITGCDVLILKTGTLAVPHTALHRGRFFEEFKKTGPRPIGFEYARGVSLPDKSKAYILVNSKQWPSAKGT